MDAMGLYSRVDKDFELDRCKDNWSRMGFNEFISEDFKKRHMSLLLDSTDEIRKVYTAVFPSDKAIKKVLASGEGNILLLVHHPMVWDIKLKGYPFKNISKNLLKRLRKKKVSIYALHVPLDKNGPYSTTITLARAIGIKPEDEFYEYHGVKVGIFGKTECKTIHELADKVKSVVGHKVKVWNYGANKIRKKKVALVAGGGNDPEVADEIAEAGINILVTGVTKPNKNYQPSLDFHEIAKENKINIIGATHYSTEKFACIALVDYFKRLGLPCQFIEDEPSFEDLE